MEEERKRRELVKARLHPHWGGGGYYQKGGKP